MAPPPKLTPEQWAAVRIEFETSATTATALAEKYGISESAVRKRAGDASQPGGVWKRAAIAPMVEEGAARAAGRLAKEQNRKRAEKEAAKAAKEAAKKKADSATAPSETHHPPPSDSANGDSANAPSEPVAPSERKEIPGIESLKPSYRNPTTLAMADPMVRAALRDDLIESVAEALAKANSDHLEHRVGPLKTLYRQMIALILQATTTPDPNDPEAVARQGRAQAALLAGRSDTLGAHIQALIKLAESIQAQERRAFGVDEKPKRVEVSGPGGMPVQLEATPVIDMTRMSTSQMEQLYSAALLLEGQQERPGIPLPPGDDPPESEPDPGVTGT